MQYEMKAVQFDLFDKEAAKGAGERQCDLEDIIDQKESLIAMMKADDQAGVSDWLARAKAGEVMRIC